MNSLRAIYCFTHKKNESECQTHTITKQLYIKSRNHTIVHVLWRCVCVRLWVFIWLGSFGGFSAKIVVAREKYKRSFIVSLSWCNVKTTFKCVSQRVSQRATATATTTAMVKHTYRALHCMQCTWCTRLLCICDKNNHKQKLKTHWNQRTSLYREIEWKNCESRELNNIEEKNKYRERERENCTRTLFGYTILVRENSIMEEIPEMEFNEIIVAVLPQSQHKKWRKSQRKKMRKSQKIKPKDRETERERDQHINAPTTNI